MSDLPEPGEVQTDEVDNRTRLQKKKEVHQLAAKNRADAQNTLKISYKKIREEPAFADILVKAQGLHDLHLRLAKDGVGYQNTGKMDANGNPEQATVFFTHEKRVTELDKAAGIEELTDYIKRQTSDENITPVAPKKIVS
jgi:hypothetical protein